MGKDAKTDENRWWLLPGLVILILAMLAALHLLKHQNVEFLYSLF